MALTTHLGYGKFQLADFRPGECFARFDGTLAKVIDPQPPGRPDHILVRNNHETNNAELLWLHRTALAYAVTPEHARRVAQRSKGKLNGVRRRRKRVIPTTTPSTLKGEIL